MKNNLVLTLSQGHYQSQIDQALHDASAMENGEALFLCLGGDNGIIEWITTCGTCHNGGSGKNDYCN